MILKNNHRYASKTDPKAYCIFVHGNANGGTRCKIIQVDEKSNYNPTMPEHVAANYISNNYITDSINDQMATAIKSLEVI